MRRRLRDREPEPDRRAVVGQHLGRADPAADEAGAHVHPRGDAQHGAQMDGPPVCQPEGVFGQLARLDE
ncbi:MAG: hypothetical protein WKG01_33150 [Kofleriaceae bacterium]